MGKPRFSAVVLGMLGTMAASSAGAQESSAAASKANFDAASPAAVAEAIRKMSPADRAEVMRLTETVPAAAALASPAAPAPAENDFLCTEGGCIGGSLYAGWSSWTSAAQALMPNNNGGVAGFDIASPVPYLAADGIGVQAGGSFGIYDWSGVSILQTGGHQRQNFFTLGAFRQPDFRGPWWQRFGAGFAYDYSANSEFGIYRDNVNLRQWRGKFAIELTDHQEIGALGSWHSGQATSVRAAQNSFPMDFRSASQISLYYKYTFDNNANLELSWAPGETSTISNLNTSAYHYGYHDVIGIGAQVPLNDYFALFVNGTYAFENSFPNANLNLTPFSDAFVSLFGIKFFWGGDAATPAWQRRHWEPFLPNADNGNFLIDGMFGTLL